MDGNHRWATQHNVSIEIGYRKGADAAERIIQHSSNIGIKYLTLYAFSIENWNRPKKEVNLILNIFQEMLLKRLETCKKENMRIIFIGDRSHLNADVIELMQKVEQQSESASGLCVIIAFSYSSRHEILCAAKKAMMCNDKNFENAFENAINPYNIPYPDLLIRTSGEMRISNFLLWQLAYSELYFTSVLWPDFNENHLNDACDEFKIRNRRFGKR